MTEVGESQFAAATLSAAERRERRRAKILASSESRLQRILSGPTGEEARQAPAIEGGNGYKLAAPSEPEHVFSTADSTTHDEGDDADFVVRRRRSPLIFENATVAESMPTLEELNITYEPSRVLAFIDQRKFILICILGLLFFAATTTGVFSSVWLPWSILYVSHSIVRKRDAAGSLYPSHGYLVNTLIWMGFSEKLTIHLGFFFEAFSSYIEDTSALAAVYVVASIIKDTVDRLSS